MEFSVLGPLEVHLDGTPLALGAGKLHFLLAALVSRANSAVSTNRLIQALWWGDPPRTAAKNLQVNVHHLRRVLGGGDQDGPARVLRRSDGYQLTVAPGELDRDRFDQFAAAAGAAAAQDRWEQADLHYRQALALWRGRPYAGLERADLLQQEADRLAERRLSVVEAAVEAKIALGRHDEALAHLEQLVTEHPFREQLRAQQMIALYRSGRQVEALAVYDDARRVLAAELGLTPGGLLRQVQRAVLDGATDPGRRARTAVPAARSGGNTSQLPPGSGDLIDRPELDRVLCALLTGSEEYLPAAAAAAATAAPSAAAVPQTAELPGRAAALADAAPAAGSRGVAADWMVVVLCGPSGSGTSTLLVQVARRVADAFPDGLLYLDLRPGDGPPLDRADALAALLRAGGLPSAALPAATEDRLRLYRERLHGRRTLVLLDNAFDEEQVRPLLPTTPGCATVVAAHARLSALPGARRLQVPPFLPEQGVELLRRTLGDGRVDADPDAAYALVRACGALPGALRHAAADLADHPARPLDAPAPTPGLDAAAVPTPAPGPPPLPLPPVPDVLAHMLQPPDDPRLLAGAEFDAEDWAGLLELTPRQAESLLDHLCALHLVERRDPTSGPGHVRYRYALAPLWHTTP